MKICFVSPEVFGWGCHGGFGFLTRTLARGIVERGHEVCVVTVRRGGQGEVEEVDGFTVYGFSAYEGVPLPVRAFLSRLASLGFYRRADADIYHSQAVSYNTVAAQSAAPERPHLITFQDPYDVHEWRRISLVDRRYRLTPAFRSRIALENMILSRACRAADALCAQARFLIPKARRLFQLGRDPLFLPNPVVLPQRTMRKACSPTVCFLARWDPQKRVELFFRLAEDFPDVEFLAMGRSHDPLADALLRKRCRGIPNLACPGFVSEEEKSRILEKSWALVNTSVREALPLSFLEALAHETPILSGEDPDGLTSRYGYRVRGGDYGEALEAVLRDDSWREKGKLGRSYVEEVHEVSKVVDMHLKIYRGVLESRS